MRQFLPLGTTKGQLRDGKACACMSFINSFQDVDCWKKPDAKTLFLPINVNCLRDQTKTSNSFLSIGYLLRCQKLKNSKEEHMCMPVIAWR